jgi:hypothetical protein
MQARRKAVWDTGTAGRAKVPSIAPDRGEPYAVATSAIIEQVCIPQVQPQYEIRVRIDPDDPTFVVLDEKVTSPWYLPR